MTSEIRIRPERAEDIEAIGEVIDSAFAGMPYAAGDEAELVVELRIRDALIVSLVAEEDDEVVGQIAFSSARTSADSQNWAALGPVSVLPSHQSLGIGSSLIREGLQKIRERGADGCILTGNPAYYRRFGFEVTPESAPPGEPPQFFMIQTFRGQTPIGPIHFHEAFGAHDEGRRQE